MSLDSVNDQKNHLTPVESSVSINETVMSALLRLARKLSGHVSLKELSVITAKECKELFELDTFLLVVLNTETREQTEVYGEDVMEGQVCPQPVAVRRESFATSARGMDLLTGEPVLINRQDGQRPSTIPFGNVKRRSRSLMYCPIKWKGNSIGNLSIQSYTQEKFTDDDLQLLSMVASQLGGPMWRLRTERALYESEDRLGRLLENSNDFLALFNIEGKCVYFKASNKFVSSGDKFVGKSPEGIFGGALAQKIKRGIESVVKTNSPESSDFSIPFKGETYCFNTRLYPVINEHGGLSGVGLIACDVTDLRRAEDERWRLNEKVLEAQKLESLANLAGGIAQDLGNMIFGIESCAKLAVEEHSKMSDTQQNALHQIVQTTERANRLVGQLNAYSGSGQKDERVVPIGKVIRGVEHLLSSLKGPSVEIYFELDHDEARIEADRNEVEQIVMDLLQNAAEAIPEGQNGTITIGCGMQHLDGEWLETARPRKMIEPGDYALFWVKDNGMGIDDETLDKIFDPFYTTKEIGRGLGLSVCLGVIRSHGGAIRVVSSPGNGTKIEVALPEVKEGVPTNPSREVDLSAETAIPKTGKILLVESEDSARFAMETFLKRNQFSIYTASNGMDAIQTLDRMNDRLDLVVLDVNIRGVPCEQLTKHFLSKGGDIPLIFTSRCRKGCSVENSGKNKVVVMNKPFPLRTLLSRINHLLSD